MEQTWNSYISSLNPNFLPRQVEVTSGKYFSGSLSTLSFSKGDIIKIINIVPSNLTAEVNDGSKVLGMVTIPLGYEGKFQLMADPIPFETVADLVHSVRISQGPTAHICPSYFQNLLPISTAEVPMVLQKREKLSLLGFEEHQGKKLLRCQVLREESQLSVLLPMDCQGLFQECQDQELYSIDTIVRWKLWTGRKRSIRAATGHYLRDLSSLIPEHFNGHLVLLPGFSVTALLPGNIQISIPSDLDIHVTDITDLGNRPQKTMSMKQIYNMKKSKFPLRIRIMSVVLAENKTNNRKNLPLTCGQLLTVLRTEEVKKFIVTGLSRGEKRRHFLVPSTYQGTVLRKGRYFRFVADVAKAMQGGQLLFQPSRDFTSCIGALASFTSKDSFLALKKSVVSAEITGEMHRVEILKCQNIVTKVKVKLPLFAEGHFIELVDQAGPGRLQDLCETSKLPCYIAVLCPDPSIGKDPLYGITDLRVENAIIEQCLVVKDSAVIEDIYSDGSEYIYSDGSEAIYSNITEPAFEIPIEKISAEVSVLEECPCTGRTGNESSSTIQNVEEITEEESLTFSNYVIAPCPPPCPPKPKSLP